MVILLKCKVCGGDIHADASAAFGTCDSCGVTSTLPKANDEKLVNLFNRANHFRRLNEFDKALAAYESILNEDNTNAEAHWGVVLCRYGIEYVEDPRTHERVPTCHRVQYTSIMNDADFQATLDNASDGYTRELYNAEAKKISDIQKGILAISNREEPFDVFICYKETTDGGSRTKDSTIAQDIYYQLNNEGYRVFFSRITLENRLGQEYEPYIFAALNSAKVMLVIGTKPEYFSSVWVKNEWSRFLTLTRSDHSRLLIPCYRDMDPYDLPEELSMFQCQDMSKIGFLQDLIRGISKVLAVGRNSNEEVKAYRKADLNEPENDPDVQRSMKRGYIYLEDEDWDKAEYCFRDVIEIFDYAPAYLGWLCATLRLRQVEELTQNDPVYKELDDYRKIVCYAETRAGYLLLEDEEWKSADEHFAEALDEDPEYAPAYVGKLCVELGASSAEQLVQVNPKKVKSLSGYRNYQRAIRFADASYRSKLEKIEETVRKRSAEEIRREQERIDLEEKKRAYEEHAERERKEREERAERERKEREERAEREKNEILERERQDSRSRRPFHVVITVIMCSLYALWLLILFVSMDISDWLSALLIFYLPYIIITTPVCIILRLLKLTENQCIDLITTIGIFYSLLCIAISVSVGIIQGVRTIIIGVIVAFFVQSIAIAISLAPSSLIGKKKK